MAIGEMGPAYNPRDPNPPRRPKLSADHVKREFGRRQEPVREQELPPICIGSVCHVGRFYGQGCNQPTFEEVAGEWVMTHPGCKLMACKPDPVLPTPPK